MQAEKNPQNDDISILFYVFKLISSWRNLGKFAPNLLVSTVGADGPDGGISALIKTNIDI